MHQSWGKDVLTERNSSATGNFKVALQSQRVPNAIRPELSSNENLRIIKSFVNHVHATQHQTPTLAQQA